MSSISNPRTPTTAPATDSNAAGNAGDAQATIDSSTAGPTDSLTAEGKQQVTQNQSEAILASTSAATKHGCHMQYTNRADMVHKMQGLGFTAKEAGLMTRILQDSRFPGSAKQKIAYELAALGLTGAGQANTKPISSNATQMRAELGKYADSEEKQLDTGHALGVAATVSGGIVGAIVAAVASTAAMNIY